MFVILGNNFDSDLKSVGLKGLNLFFVANNNISDGIKIISKNLKCLLSYMTIISCLLSILTEIFDSKSNNNNNNDNILTYLANIERQSNNLINNIKSQITINKSDKNNNNNNNNKKEDLENKHLNKKVPQLPKNNLYYNDFPYDISYTSFCGRSNDYSLSKLNKRSQKNIIIGGYTEDETEFYELKLDKNENGEKCICYDKFNDKYKSGIKIVCLFFFCSIFPELVTVWN